MFGFLAQLLAWCYDVWPNYAGMILLFTLIVMVAVTPFTIKGMRSAAEMSRLQPELKKVQDQYKNDRIKQNEEVQALFKEHGVNPLGGCLPTLLPLPIFFIIFRLLERMTARHSGSFAPLLRLVRQQKATSPAGFVSPHYLKYTATLTQSIIHADGALKAFGMDLAKTAVQHHDTTAQAIPFFALIVIMTVSQYWQQRQINMRNPQAMNANPQMKLTMQIFPMFYAVISLRIPAAVVLYLLLSGLYRMAQNSISYRYDPVLARAAAPAGPIDATSTPRSTKSGSNGAGGRVTAGDRSDSAAPAKRGGFFDQLREAAGQAKAQQADRTSGRSDSKAGAGSNGSNIRSKDGDRKRVSDAAPSQPPAKPDKEPKPERPTSERSSPLSVRPSGRVTPPGGGGNQKRGKKR